MTVNIKMNEHGEGLCSECGIEQYWHAGDGCTCAEAQALKHGHDEAARASSRENAEEALKEYLRAYPGGEEAWWRDFREQTGLSKLAVVRFVDDLTAAELRAKGAQVLNVHLP